MDPAPEKLKNFLRMKKINDEYAKYGIMIISEFVKTESSQNEWQMTVMNTVQKS